MLELVISNKKKQELIAVLDDRHPSHPRRLWLVGFLRFVGYSETDVCSIIHNHNRWSDYNRHYTRGQVASVFSSEHKIITGTDDNPFDIQQLQKLVMHDRPMTFAGYYSAGLVPIPIQKNGKRSLVKWDKYQKQIPSIRSIRLWDDGLTKGKLNVAIVCGNISGNLVVLDFDSDVSGSMDTYYEHLGRFHGSPMVITPHGGRHIYTTSGRISINSSYTPKFEVRSEGEYVLVPPSVIDDKRYEWV